ncbi:MAG: extracellular solute-binding protein [Prochloraceae cyanobacterium]
MKSLSLNKIFSLPFTLSLLLLASCQAPTTTDRSNPSDRGIEIKFSAGSNLGKFCQEIATKLNQTKPKLKDGQRYYLTCEAKGSGDVINALIDLAEAYQTGNITAEDPQFPTLLSVDGEIYQSQLIYEMNRIFPGQNYIREITDSPLIANSPMVLMTTAELAPALEKLADPYSALVNYQNFSQIDPNVTAIPIRYVHTAPTRSNSGLQTLVAQFVSVSGIPPERLTVEDVKKYQEKVREIESKIARYGVSTTSLAESMVKNGPYWASVGSVYESVVIRANSKIQPDRTAYKAVYPKATYSSNIRAILPRSPWVSEAEKAAAEEIIEYMRQPENQQIAIDLGLRPGIPGVALSNKFSPQFGVQTNPVYESYRAPKPEVVAAMLESWTEFAKKPSFVAIVVDTSGSMQGQKIAAVQNTLLNYIQNLGPKEKIALIRFSSNIEPPIIADGTKKGRDRAVKFINNLRADGGTKLYDSTLYARSWLEKNIQSEAINAVLILTDGQDSGSQTTLQNLKRELQNQDSDDNPIAFFTIGYGKKGEFNPKILEEIASISGGYYSQGNPETISQLMEKLQLEF